MISFKNLFNFLPFYFEEGLSFLNISLYHDGLGAFSFIQWVIILYSWPNCPILKGIPFKLAPLSLGLSLSFLQHFYTFQTIRYNEYSGFILTFAILALESGLFSRSPSCC